MIRLNCLNRTMSDKWFLTLTRLGTVVVLLLSSLLSSCVTTSPIVTNDVPIVKLYAGSYKAAKSSDGTMRNWTLYSNGVVTGDWITTKNSRTLGIKGHWEYINDNTVAIEASGDISVFGLTMAKARITALGQIRGNEISGYFILFVDQDAQWADFGNFVASEVEN